MTHKEYDPTMTVTRTDGRKRVVIEGITPAVDGGRFPAKRTVGDQVRVEADIFTDGHDALSASLLAHREGSEEWTEIPMRPLVNDRWTAAFRVGELGRYGFKVRGWVDHFETWRRDLLKRIEAESDTTVDYQIGADLVEEAAGRAAGGDAVWLLERAEALRAAKEPEEMRTSATDPKLHELVLRYPDLRFATESEGELSVVVDPVRARFSAWYELFPRSTAEEPGKHGTFADCEKRLEYIAAMGFNVVYLPPIHPIGAPLPQRAQQHSRGAAGRLRKSVGHRLGGRRTQGDPQRIGNNRGFPALCGQGRRTWPVGRAGHRVPGRARSSLCART